MQYSLFCTTIPSILWVWALMIFIDNTIENNGKENIYNQRYGLRALQGYG